MKVAVLSPTVTLIKEATEAEKSKLQSLSSFKNTSVGYLIKQHQGKSWLKKNKPDVWNATQRDLSSKYEGSILERHGDIIITKTGHLPYLMNEMDIEIVENRIVYPEPKEIPFKKPLPFELYPYQKEAVEKLIKEKHGNVELCTGAGKQAIILKLTQIMGLKTLIIVPSKILFDEMYEAVSTHFPENEIGLIGDGKRKLGKRITVAISKSLTMLKKDTEEYHEIQSSQVMIVDETHLFAASTLDEVCHGLLRTIPYRFFMTGTLARGDGTLPILQSIVGKTVLEMDTKEGIAKGYLGNIDFNIIESYSPSKMQYKDPGKMRRVHFLNNTEIARQVVIIANNAGQNDESTLIFVDELSQIPLITKLLTVSYGYIHGNSTDKEDQARHGITKCDSKKTIEDFNTGKIRVLIVSPSGFCGVNFFAQNKAIFWVGSSSQIEVRQSIIGRNVRILAKSKYAKFHKPRDIIHLYDFKVAECESSLKKRLTIYRTTGQPIHHIKLEDICGIN